MKLRLIRMLAFNKGQNLDETKLIGVLHADLEQTVGKLHPLKGKYPPANRFHTESYTVVPMKGPAVAKLLNELDFAVTKSDNLGVVGGTRVDLPRHKTVVVYSALSGVLTISSTLTTASSVVDV